MTTQKTGKWIAYYRVSTARQGASGLGLEAQQEAVRTYLNGGSWELVAEYTEVESGTKKGNSRPQLAKALAHAKREKATLVIAKWDRLGRNVAFVSNLLESGVEFCAVDNPHATRLTIHIMAAVAEEEARAISARTKAALAAAKKRGVALGTPDNLTPEAQAKGAEATKGKAIKAYAKISPLILNLRAEGNSLREIADHLNQIGEVTVTGLSFNASTVKRIIDRATS